MDDDQTCPEQVMLRERKVFIGAIRRLLDKWEADAYAYEAT